jgi:hypothetical protein
MGVMIMIDRQTPSLESDNDDVINWTSIIQACREEAQAAIANARDFFGTVFNADRETLGTVIIAKSWGMASRIMAMKTSPTRRMRPRASADLPATSILCLCCLKISTRQ